MRRSKHDRSTYVLVVGQSSAEWSGFKSSLKSGLQGMHMGWSCPSDAVPTAEEAVDIIARRDDLEVVCFARRTISSDEVLREEAEKIAKALGRHKHKPWVLLDEECDFLKPIFDSALIRVEQGSLVDVVAERWRSQVSEDKMVA